MDIAARKLKFVERFLSLSDEKTLVKLERLLNTETKQSAHLSPMRIEEFNAMIDKSEEDYKNGNVIEAKAILKQIDEW